MLKVIRISGNSLEPLFHSGDFALLWARADTRIKPRDVVAFRHPRHGLLIKRVRRITEHGELFVQGTRPDSMDSHSFGTVPRSSVIGKVVWHIHNKQS